VSGILPIFRFKKLQGQFPEPGAQSYLSRYADSE